MEIKNIKFFWYIFVLMAVVLFCSCASKSVKIDNKLIDKDITSLTELAKKETDSNKKSVIQKAIEKLQYAKKINIENDKLIEKQKSDKKFTSAGKLLYCFGGIIAFLFCAFLVFRAVRFFVRI